MNTNEEKVTAVGQLRRVLNRNPGDRAMRVERDILEGVLAEFMEYQQASTRAMDQYEEKLLAEMERVKDLLPQIHGEAGVEAKRRLRISAEKMRQAAASATVDELIAMLESGAFEPEKKKRTTVQYVAEQR
jgi:seryl-tRNA(Sec) selenium transferase